MTVKADRLARLAKVAQLKRDAESQALAAINAEIRGLQFQISRLRRIVRLRSRDLELDPSRLSGADVQWVRRTEKQIAGLQTEMARAYVTRETLTDAARRAVGRAEVADRLVKEARTPRIDWDA